MVVEGGGVHQLRWSVGLLLELLPEQEGALRGVWMVSRGGKTLDQPWWLIGTDKWVVREWTSG
jgi:hypothetical protein